MPESNLATVGRTKEEEIYSFIQRRMDNPSDPVRSSALSILRESGLPGNKHEEYKYAPVTRELGNKFTFAETDVPGQLADIKPFLIPDVEANLLVFINGRYSREHSVVRSPSSELTVTTLEEALASGSITAAEHFGRYVDLKRDAFAAWNAADWQSGMFIQIPENTTVQTPVVIHSICDASAGEVIATQRNLVVAGRNSQLTLVEKFDSTGGANHFTNLVTEIVVGENAGLEFYSIHNDAGKRYQVGQTVIYQRNSSRVNTYSFNLRGQLVRTNLSLVLDGEGIESHMYGLYALGGDSLADNHTVVDHKKPNSFSNELYKGIIDGKSRGVFNGKIFVRPQAQKTNAFQANRNILLSDTAIINTKPQLEIWADDVKCSHGCTTGQLDEEALFYLRARGISKEAAKAMMLYAFAGEVVEKVAHAEIRKYIDLAIGERLHKNF